MVERISNLQSQPRDSEFESGRGRKKGRKNRDHLVVAIVYILQVHVSLRGCRGCLIWGRNQWIPSSNPASGPKNEELSLSLPSVSERIS